MAHGDAHAIDRLDMADRAPHDAALDREPDLEIVGLDHDRRVGACRRGIGLGLGGEQRAGIGMLRRGEDALDRPLLDDPALLHHADDVGELAHDAQIVGDEQHRHAEPRLQLLQQGEDLRLHGDVERGGRLIRDEEIRLVGECHGDHRALALAAGELVGIALEPQLRIGDADLAEQLDGACARGEPGQSAMQQENLADLLLDGVQRIERGHRLLEDDRDIVAAHAANLGLRQVEQLGWCAAGYGRSLSTESAVTDLPEPDSPTSATVSPFLMAKEMRSTASVSRAPCRKAVDNSLTSSSRS